MLFSVAGLPFHLTIGLGDGEQSFWLAFSPLWHVSGRLSLIVGGICIWVPFHKKITGTNHTQGSSHDLLLAWALAQKVPLSRSMLQNVRRLKFAVRWLCNGKCGQWVCPRQIINSRGWYSRLSASCLDLSPIWSSIRFLMFQVSLVWIGGTHWPWDSACSWTDDN